MYQSRCQWLGDGAGTHVSVHVYRMQGEHDHELFRETSPPIILQLVNHNNEQDHLQEHCAWFTTTIMVD